MVYMEHCDGMRQNVRQDGRIMPLFRLNENPSQWSNLKTYDFWILSLICFYNWTSVTVLQLLNASRIVYSFFFFLKESKHVICMVEVKERNEVYWEAREIYLIYSKSFGGKEALSKAVFYPYAVKRIQLKINSNFVHTFPLSHGPETQITYFFTWIHRTGCDRFFALFSFYYGRAVWSICVFNLALILKMLVTKLSLLFNIHSMLWVILLKNPPILSDVM